MHYSSGAFKYIAGWLLVFLIRLIPFRAPNIEPVMAALMPYAKRYGIIGGLMFGTLSIVLFDLATGTMGQWTLITASAYGMVGVGSAIFFRSRSSSRKNYVLFAVMGTIFYDAATGLSIGPLFFSQPFSEAFFGQIPFTMWHLAGNIAFALVLSPALWRWIVINPKFETGHILRTIQKVHAAKVEVG